MPSYYIQSASAGANTRQFYGEQGKHNHKKETAFSKGVKEVMKLTYPNTPIRLGDIRSNQAAGNLPDEGIELHWVNGGWTNQ